MDYFTSSESRLTVTRSFLNTDSLTIGYRSWKDTVKILSEPLNLNIKEGEFICLLGPNGAGKSTLIRTLSGLLPPLSGEVFIQERNLVKLNSYEKASTMAIVLTERIDIGTFTVWDVISLGRYPYTSGAGRLKPKDHIIIDEIIEAVGISELQHRYFNELSDGEKQKVMISRALAQKPKLLFLDEPTAFLDLPGRVEIVQLLRKITRTTGTSILMSTHDLDLALGNADKIWLLGKNGTCETGAPEDLVLNQAFENIFQRKDVFFDPYRGSFSVVPKICGRVGFQGKDLLGHWTTHALEREGFEVIPYESTLPFTIEVDKENKQWCSTFHGEKRIHSSILDLMMWARTIKEK